MPWQILPNIADLGRLATTDRCIVWAESESAVPLDLADCLMVDLSDPFSKVGCLIMASGSSVRFGSNKLLEDFCHRPLIEHVLSTTSPFFNRIVVTRTPQIAKICQEFGIPALLHALPDRSDTIRLGLNALPATLLSCGFLPADQPMLSFDTVATLALCSLNDAEHIYRPQSNGVQGSPIFFSSGYFAELRSLPLHHGGSFLVKKYPERLRTVTVRDAIELRDIDYPEDLRSFFEQ